MEVHDERIPDGLFARCTAVLPQACVEVLLRHDGGVLLARRTNEPARGEWFWPGARLRKGELVTDGARRVARAELGIEVALEGLFGVYDHFWDRSGLPGEPDRHTVNVVFAARPAADDPEIRLDDQHDDYRFVSSPEPELHPYVRRYLEDGALVD